VNPFGGIDILVNNAAVSIYVGGISKIPIDLWDKMFDINVKAGFLLTQLTVPYLLKS
jgi:NAD(P)-dependent dehydrogenase (short-subunit alcohol dehydrogenase family)